MDHFPGRQGRATAGPRIQPRVAGTDPTPESAAYESQPVRASQPVHKAKAGLSRQRLIWTGGAVVVLVAGLLILAYMLTRGSTSLPGVDASKYQAIFLSNGQAYFGKLTAAGSDYYKLSDIYYLQTNTSDDTNNLQNASKDQNANVQLIKLGNEVHGPEDSMIIGRDQVLFYENLKSDGKVSTTIADFQKSKK